MKRLADIVGSITCITCLVVAGYLAYAAWRSHRIGMEGWNLMIYGVAIFFEASLLTGFTAWRSIRRK